MYSILTMTPCGRFIIPILCKKSKVFGIIGYLLKGIN